MIFIFVLFIVGVIYCILSGLFQMCWNVGIAPLGMPEINFLQALAASGLMSIASFFLRGGVQKGLLSSFNTETEEEKTKRELMELTDLIKSNTE